MKIKAYAKINLSLKVNGVIENGYHKLQMINSKISLYDIIYIKKSKKDVFKMTNNICDNKDNIGYKAYQLIKDKYNIKNNYNIYIIKRIPVGAGLGGGSTDAASIIKALIKLEKIGIEEKELIKMACSLGADVPYCLFNEICLVEGIGEIITKIPIKKSYKLILACPRLFVSTKEVFKNYSKSDCEQNIDGIIANKSINCGCIFNDLEKSTKKVYPDYKLDELKEKFVQHGATNSIMTGSGSTVFAIFDVNENKNLNKVYKFMKKNYQKVKFFKCKTISC